MENIISESVGEVFPCAPQSRRRRPNAPRVLRRDGRGARREEGRSKDGSPAASRQVEIHAPEVPVLMRPSTTQPEPESCAVGTARPFTEWGQEHDIAPCYIQPGAPITMLHRALQPFVPFNAYVFESLTDVQTLSHA